VSTNISNTAKKKLTHIDILTNLFNSQESTSVAQKEAFTALKEAGIPTLRTERWKYTPLRKVIHTDLHLQDAQLSQLSKHAVIESLLNSDTDFEIAQVVNGTLHGEFAQENVSLIQSDEILKPNSLNH